MLLKGAGGIKMEDEVPPHLPKRRHDGFDRQKQRAALLGIFDEFGATAIEPPGRVILRMNQHGAYADALRSQSDTPQRIREDVGAEPFARIAAINRQTPDHGDRDRVGRVAPDLSGRRRAPHGARRNAVPSDDLLAMANDVGSRKTAFVFQRPMAKPIVQLRLAAVEGREVICAIQEVRSFCATRNSIC